MNPNKTRNFVENFWDSDVMPHLTNYISIPCKSPFYDENWQQNGFLVGAINLMVQWVRDQNIPGLQFETLCLGKHSPFLYIEIPGDTNKTIMFYGHLDKMPEAEGWRDDLHPWKPIIEGHKLYGRGGLDDGYAIFSVITAIKVLKEQNLAHDRYVIIVETAEESASPGFEEYIEYFRKKIGNPELVIMLDCMCNDYERLWITNSLRGMVTGSLQVSISREGMHSGVASGAIPSTFRIARQLLDRIEDSRTGNILIESANVAIPDDRIGQAQVLAELFSSEIQENFPLIEGCKLASDDISQVLLNCNWRPSLAVTGVEGIPQINCAGNILRPFTTLLLSLRLPPGSKVDRVIEDLKMTFENDPPYNAKVVYTPLQQFDGWAAPKMPEHLENIISDASREHFGEEPMYIGCGGSIGIVKLLGTYFPEAQFIVTGLEGPGSNAHGPNEFLHIPAAKNITSAVAHILARHGSH